jgi:hypothetical protein
MQSSIARSGKRTLPGPGVEAPVAEPCLSQCPVDAPSDAIAAVFGLTLHE